MSKKKYSDAPVEEIREADILEETVEKPQEPKKVKISKAVVSGCALLNFREEPNKDGNIIAILSEGTEVEVSKVAGNNEWLLCKHESGIEAYAMSKFLKRL